ncbi:DUF3160 domain-containing protein [Planctomycetota bacterium]
MARRTGALTSVVLLLIVSFGVASAPAGEEKESERGGPIAQAGAKLAERYGKHYKPVRADAKPSLPGYDLPVDPKEIANREVLAKLSISGEAQRALLKDGFALVFPSGPHSDNLVSYYGWLDDLGVPIYVTADSVLHLYHIQFDELLRELEERELIGALEGLLGALHEEVAKVGATVRKAQSMIATYPEEIASHGILRAHAFLATAERLLSDRTGERHRLTEARGRLKEIAAIHQGEHWGRFWDAWSRFCVEFADVRRLLMEANTGLPADKRLEKWAFDEPSAQQLKHIVGLCERCEREAAARAETARQARSTLPPEVEALVASEVANVLGRKGPQESAIFTYEEDFTHYVPRGHYTRSARLKRYFLTMMYLGRMTFLAKGGEPHGPTEPYLVSPQESHVQLAAAAVLSRALGVARVGDRKAMDVWWRIYGLTGFFAGLADDITAPDYGPAVRRAKATWLGFPVPKKDFRPGKTEGAEIFDRLKLEIARLERPAIYSGTGAIVYLEPAALAGEPSPEVVDRALAATHGFRLMGQRFTPDSYLQGRLAHPVVNRYLSNERKGAAPFSLAVLQEVGRRGFPRGLDVAALLLGSRRAHELLSELSDSSYAGYADTAAVLADDVAALTSESWNGNLYYAWLYALRGLVGVEYGEGYPTYMRGRAWATKELMTALGSWSQLRHDTILYVKPPVAPCCGEEAEAEQKKEVMNQVEPVPELFARLLALTRFTRAVLEQEKALGQAAAKRLENTEDLLTRLLTLARRELSGQKLSKEDSEYLKYMAAWLQSAMSGADLDAMKTTVIADVFTEATTQTVVEVGTGPLALLVVASPLPGGGFGLVSGPAFTTYEFKHPAEDRLTDEAWREMLRAGNGRRDLLADWARSLYR